MNIKDLSDNLNTYFKEKNLGLSVKNYMEPSDFTYTDEQRDKFGLDAANNKAGFIKITESISAIVFTAEGKVTGIELLTNPHTQAESLDSYKSIVACIDVLTPMSLYKRNGLLKRLGLNDGTFAKGKRTKRNGYLYKVVMAKDICKLSIMKL